MATVITFLTQYWWGIAILALIGIYAGLRSVAKSKSRDLITQYLQGVENNVLLASDAAIGPLADTIYNTIPLRVRVFIPRKLFDTLVVDAYTEVRSTLQAESSAVAPTTPVPPVTPAPTSQTK